MGTWFSALSKLFGGREPERRLLMLGLDAAGKTTILYKLQLGDAPQTMPTIGFNVETLKLGNSSLVMWDIGGQEKLRGLWRHYYQHTDGLIFVVDSSDKGRLEEAKEEFHRVLSDELLKSVAILVYANKRDLPNAASASDVAKALGLSSERARHWTVQDSNAVSGDGLLEGMTWMITSLNQKKRATAIV